MNIALEWEDKVWYCVKNSNYGVNVWFFGCATETTHYGVTFVTVFNTTHVNCLWWTSNIFSLNSVYFLDFYTNKPSDPIRNLKTYYY